jgi:hypothetical protein
MSETKTRAPTAAKLSAITRPMPFAPALMNTRNPVRSTVSGPRAPVTIALSSEPDLVAALEREHAARLGRTARSGRKPSRICRTLRTCAALLSASFVRTDPQTVFQIDTHVRSIAPPRWQPPASGCARHPARITGFREERDRSPVLV